MAPHWSQPDPSDNQMPTQDGTATASHTAVKEVAKAFQAVLEQEDQALREQFPQGFNPMEAQARALLWLVALRGLHIDAVKQAIDANKGEAVSGWAEDLGKLSAAISILDTIQPIP